MIVVTGCRAHDDVKSVTRSRFYTCGHTRSEKKAPAAAVTKIACVCLRPLKCSSEWIGELGGADTAVGQENRDAVFDDVDDFAVAGDQCFPDLFLDL